LSWLFGIASHKAADHFRQKREHLSLDEVIEVHHPDPLPEETASTHLQMQRVSQALQALSPERAEAVVLRIFSGLSAAEVGRRLGKSEAAAKMLVYRGLSDLQQRLVLEPEVER
jgi:RNA polymerase sigma-70 factor (ECF subfamily)